MRKNGARFSFWTVVYYLLLLVCTRISCQTFMFHVSCQCKYCEIQHNLCEDTTIPIDSIVTNDVQIWQPTIVKSIKTIKIHAWNICLSYVKHLSVVYMWNICLSYVKHLSVVYMWNICLSYVKHLSVVCETFVCRIHVKHLSVVCETFVCTKVCNTAFYDIIWHQFA
jgi:hypothetical protein